MIQRNLAFILIAIAMVISIMSYDFANTTVGSRPFWLFLGSITVLVAALILIIINESLRRRGKL